MNRDEGVIKFNCHLKYSNFSEINIDQEKIKELVGFRNQFYEMNLIGEYQDGIGFGNISIRLPNTENHFIISGSATGGIAKASEQHFSLVVKSNLQNNSIYCEGPIKASSESLTHFMFYQLSNDINVVVHAHHTKLWNKNKNRLPTTNAIVPYGTVEMAKEIKRLFETTNLSEVKVLIMAGHEDGIICFGKNFKETMQRYQNLLSEL